MRCEDSMGYIREFQNHLKKTKEGVRAETVLGRSSRVRKRGWVLTHMKRLLPLVRSRK